MAKIRQTPGWAGTAGQVARGVGSLRALFDSNILIDYLNGLAPARAELERYEHPCISLISWTYGGAAARQAVTFLEGPPG